MIYKLNININIEKKYFIKSILSILYQRIININNYKYLYGNITQNIDFSVIYTPEHINIYNILLYYLCSFLYINQKSTSYINLIYSTIFDSYIIETNLDYNILYDCIKKIMDKNEFLIKNISPEYGNNWNISFTLHINYLIY